MKKVRCVIQKGKTLFYPIIKGSKYKLIDIIEERECGKYDDELLKGTCFNSEKYHITLLYKLVR